MKKINRYKDNSNYEYNQKSIQEYYKICDIPKLKKCFKENRLSIFEGKFNDSLIKIQNYAKDKEVILVLRKIETQLNIYAYLTKYTIF